MVRCPEGHESEATDYCDTCGAPIDAAPVSPAPDGSGDLGGSGGAARSAPAPTSGGSVLELDDPPAAPPQTCPHCGAVNVADALFCEACGYDFTTGTPPMGSDPVEPEIQPEPGPDVEPEPDVVPEPESEAESEPDLKPESDAEPDAEPEPEPNSEPEPEPDLDSDAEPEPEPDLDSDAQPEPEPEPEPDSEPEPEPEPDPDPEPAPPPPSHPRPRHTPPSRDLADTWVVEVWIDPDWYAVQQTDEACPSAGVPDVVAVSRSVVLVGRPSSSLGARPDVDAGADSAVSRRHAQLTSDGRRWWVEDLGSSNGTFVGAVGEPLPTRALAPGQRVEIDRDDRIYVGAWTRLVVRQATESERRGDG